MGEQHNLYKTLFVAETATADEIRKAYFILAKKFHDDLNRSASPEERAFCENALKEVNASYEILSKPDRRAAYDRSRRQPEAENQPNPVPNQARRQPHPVATPARLEFGVLRPGETRGMSFFLANEGDPARSCRISVGRDHWIKAAPDIDKLPTRIPVEVHIASTTPAGRLKGAILVQMDDIRLEVEISGMIELPPPAIRQGRGGLFSSFNRNKPQARREEARSTVKCPFCGYENPPGAGACQQCELPLTRDGLLCPFCGERLPSSACNCPGCGKFVTLW
jgi:curved DNA-binding protein CbpA